MEINLSNQGIYDFPREYCFQKNVVSLVLENNNLTDLPKEIVNLKSLKKINLLNNNIIFNIHQEKWLEQLKNNGCLIYINSEDNISKVVKKEIPKQTRYDTSVDIKSPTIKESSLMTDKVSLKEIADELSIPSKDVLEKVKNMGMEVKTAQSKVSMEEAEKIANYIMNGNDEKEVIKRSPKVTSKSIEIPKSLSRKKAELLKIITAKIPERKGLKIVKKRFDDIEIDIPKIKSLLPLKDMYDQRKVILIYTQEKDFLNLTLVEYHNNEFSIIDNIFKDNSGLNEITTIINEFIYDEIEDEFTLNMHNLKRSNLNYTLFKDNNLKVSEASAKIINILKDEQEAAMIIKDLELKDYSNVTLSLNLTKSEFDDEIINFRKSTLDVVKKIIATNNYTADNIDYIIGNEEALSISSIKNSLKLTFGKDIIISSEMIINTGILENKGII